MSFLYQSFFYVRAWNWPCGNIRQAASYLHLKTERGMSTLAKNIDLFTRFGETAQIYVMTYDMSDT